MLRFMSQKLVKVAFQYWANVVDVYGEPLIDVQTYPPRGFAIRTGDTLGGRNHYSQGLHLHNQYRYF